MPISEKTDKYLHAKLPIGENEKILGVYRHHWFAYASVWFSAGLFIIVILGIAIGLTSTADSASTIAMHKGQIIAGAIAFSVIVGLFSMIPVWLKSQEQVVLTEEALLQILQPTMFANKISQLSLEHIADVSVRQDFFGSIFGFGKISIETPGEQDNYEFYVLPTPHATAKCIIEAHENFSAALQGGRLTTTLGVPQPQVPQIDMQQYEQFVAFQQAQQTMAAQQPLPQPQAQMPQQNYQQSPVPQSQQPAAPYGTNQDDDASSSPMRPSSQQ